MGMKIVAGVLLALIAGSAGNNERNRTVEGKRQLETHCFGRHLIDLPAGGVLEGRYTYMNSRIEVMEKTSTPAFEALVRSKAAELKNAEHARGGDMLVARNEFGPGKVELVSWSSRASRIGHRSQLFVHSEPQKLVFAFTGEGSADRLAEFTQLSRSLAESIRYRDGAQIPTEPGFCFDRGFARGMELTDEGVAATVEVPGFPTVTISLDTYVTGKPDQPLLSRVARVPSMLLSALNGTRTLRRGTRNIGRIQGQELLVRASEDGKRSYEFLWESQGQANSIEFPFMSLQLSTSTETDARGEVNDAPFSRDEEALALWDSMLDSIRIRPGAVGPSN